MGSSGGSSNNEKEHKPSHAIEMCEIFGLFCIAIEEGRERDKREPATKYYSLIFFHYNILCLLPRPLHINIFYDLVFLYKSFT